MLRIKALATLVQRQRYSQITRKSFLNSNNIFTYTQLASFQFSLFNDKQEKVDKNVNQRKEAYEQTGSSQEEESTSNIEQRYIKKFGKPKSELLDQWLSLNHSDLQQECEKVGIETSDKHIENIQNLFEYLKKFEQKAPKKPINNDQLFQQNQNTRQKKSFFNQRESQGQLQGIDQKMHQEEFKSDINRIFSKKKKNKFEQQQKAALQDFEPQQEVEESAPQNSKAPKFTFDFNNLTRSREGKAFVEQQTSPIQNYFNDSKLIDTIFGMQPQQLNQKYNELLEDNQSILSMFAFNEQEFDKMNNLDRKKVLINMYNVKNSIETDPNQVLKTINSSQQIDYAAQKLNLLNDNSKGIIELRLLNIDNQGLSNQQLNNVKFIHQLSQILDSFPNFQRETFLNQIADNYIGFSESIFKDIGVRKALQHSEIVQLLSTSNTIDEQKIKKVRNQYYQGIKKTFNKKIVRSMNLDDKIKILKGLPPTDNYQFSSTKSLHYLFLNEILSNEQDQWEMLDFQNVEFLLERVMGMLKCRDLNNKVRTCLENIQVSNYQIENFKKIFELISEGKNNRIDIKLIVQLLFRRSLKQFTYIPNMQELPKYIDLIEFLYKRNPVIFAYMPVEMKFILYRAIQLSQEENLTLQHMTSLSKVLVPSLYKPVFYFNEMIEKSDESFKNDVNQSDLLELVDQMTKRIKDGQFQFEHLHFSTSRIHKNYKPYKEQTFLLLQKILKDLVEPNQQLSQLESKVIYKILQNEQLVIKLFRNSEQSLETISPVLVNTYQQNKQELQEYQKNEQTDLDKEIDFEKWTDIFNSLSSIQPVINSSEDLVILSEGIAFNSLDLINNKIIESKILNLNEILNLSKAILEVANKFPKFTEKFQQGAINEVIQQVLQLYFKEMKPILWCFAKIKKNFNAAKQIQLQTNRSLILKHVGTLIEFLKVTDSENHKDLSIKLLEHITNGRSLVGGDLLNLFLLVDKYKITDQVRPLLITVASNLMTIDKGKLQLAYGGNKVDQNFKKQQDKRDLEEMKNKQKIFGKYQSIYQKEPSLMQCEEAGLSPLSAIMADIINEMSNESVLMCLKMLGNKKVENYHESFIKMLYEKYSENAQLANMFQNNQTFFYEFAKQWPHFLKNNAMLNQLLKIKGYKSLVTEQSETLKILANKNVLHPELIETHFDTFIKMKDKSNVAKYLKDFMKACASLGYSKLDILKLTQVFRRIYKEPEQAEYSQLLDYFIILALSKDYYKDFDEKSIKFVEQGLDLIEKKFQGIETMEVKRVNPISNEEETVHLNYYKSVPTSSKVYNKVLIKGKEPNLDFKQAFEELDLSSESSEEELIENEQESKDFVLQEEQEVEYLGEEGQLEENQQEDTENYETSGTSKEKKIYDRKASEGLYSEELEFHQYRKKKIQDLDKKSKHLLLFSNINQLNFVDINSSDVAKAWVILFHFRSKSFDSILYDEFDTIAMRNAFGKSKGHELFSKFYLKMIDKSFKKGIRVNLTQKCEKTGWPLDISMTFNDTLGKSPKVAMYFFLQEEVCYNAKEQREEPLALQRLMINHLSSISDYRVEYVTENSFYNYKNDIDTFIDDMLQERFQV